MRTSEAEVAVAARQAGVDGPWEIKIFQRENDVAVVRGAGQTLFLKTYTKPWYGDNIAATGFCVEHEREAWRTLAAAGLGVPEVVAAETGLQNGLGRPYLLTRALAGRPFTELLSGADQHVFEQLMFAVGQYLSRMHAITYSFAGYVMPGEPSAPPNPDAWQHVCWTPEAFRKSAEATWQADENKVGAPLMHEVRAFAANHWHTLATEYEPPRFVHGDCHAHQFFAARGSRLAGFGVLDMEVASAGDTGADWVKLALELAGRFDADRRWWEPLFAGYGSEPAFDTLRLRLLAADHINYTCLGAYRWAGTRADILRRVLQAEDWHTLFLNPPSGQARTILNR